MTAAKATTTSVTANSTPRPTSSATSSAPVPPRHRRIRLAHLESRHRPGYRPAHFYDDRAFHDMPILADALEDAGCTNADLLDHCRGPGPHVRGCWAVDLLVGKSYGKVLQYLWTPRPRPTNEYACHDPRTGR